MADHPRYVNNETGVVYEKVYENKRDHEVIIRRPGETKTNKIMSKALLKINYSKVMT